MKIGAYQSFKAYFTPDSYEYCKSVKQQAQNSGRIEEYEKAYRTIKYNFPQGVLTKAKSYPNKAVFWFSPNSPIKWTYNQDNSETKELDSFIKLADDIRKISI
ncbi:hypothetical protein IJS77_04335 [bacterium]|nr:hypothetical protein [bacterium]